ncbi:MAG: TIGR00159 family protein [Planctomycetota bacterium]|nr:MAG: TIGR00159 family protein [Planctomycetota bacterium]
MPDLGNAAFGEIFILTLIMFAVLTFLRGTRGENMVKVLGIVLAVAYLLGRTLALQYELKRLTLVLDAIFQASVVALVVIFQPELRKGLALKIGSRFLSDSGGNEQIVPEVVSAASRLAKAKIGALIVLERRDPLKEYVGTGTLLDAEVKSDLLRTVFYPGTPLHDGAVIIQGGRMTAAGCFLPLTDNPAVPKALGTRHRAAIGLSEAEDALVVVVSEETGGISLAEGGVLHRDLGREELHELLERLYLRRDDEESAQPPTETGAVSREPVTERAPRDKGTSRVEPREVRS